MKNRIYDTTGTRPASLTDLQYEQAMYEARDRKNYDLNEASKYWEKVNNSCKNTPKYTASQLSTLLTAVFEKETGKTWIDVLPETKRVFDLLCMYFSEDTEFEKQKPGYSLDKGLLLIGPVGCGKTTLMRLFKSNQHACYALKSCLNVAESYITEDKSDSKRDVLEHYSNLLKTAINSNPFRQTEIGICFDDLGIEDVRKKYGNETNVLAYILTRRYDLVPHKYSHITTNKDPAELLTFYGDRLLSRFSEMFNQISYSKQAPDLRKHLKTIR